jgi:uncharacterized membrane protein
MLPPRCGARPGNDQTPTGSIYSGSEAARWEDLPPCVEFLTYRSRVALQRAVFARNLRLREDVALCTEIRRRCAMANPRSTASIAGHPIHPMLITFPVAFFISTFVCDLVYWQTANAIWATAAMWLLGAGIVMAALAAIAGLIDVVGDAQIRGLNDAWWHAGGNVVVVLIQLYSWYARYTEGTAAVVPKGLILSLIVVCLLGFTGWKGWDMVYRGRVGVADAPDARRHPGESPRRAA